MSRYKVKIPTVIYMCEAALAVALKDLDSIHSSWADRGFTLSDIPDLWLSEITDEPREPWEVVRRLFPGIFSDSTHSRMKQLTYQDALRLVVAGEANQVKKETDGKDK